jgi:hypothetical protein
MMREKSSYSFLRSLVKGQDHSFFKDLTGVFCTVGVAVELQPYGSKNLDGYRRAVVPPIHKT